MSEVIGAYLENIVATANEIPPLWQVDGRLSGNYQRVTTDLLPRLRALVSEIIANRREALHAGGVGAAAAAGSADLLGVLLEEGANGAGASFSDEDIQNILFDLIIAGSDTAASTITATLYLLHTHETPAVLQRCLDEVRGVDVCSFTSVDAVSRELPYLTACVKETLRLYPPVPFIGRRGVKSTMVGGYFVEKVRPGVLPHSTRCIPIARCALLASPIDPLSEPRSTSCTRQGIGDVLVAMVSWARPTPVALPHGRFRPRAMGQHEPRVVSGPQGQRGGGGAGRQHKHEREHTLRDGRGASDSATASRAHPAERDESRDSKQ